MYTLILWQNDNYARFVEVVRSTPIRVTTQARLHVPNGHDLALALRFMLALQEAYQVIDTTTVEILG